MPAVTSELLGDYNLYSLDVDPFAPRTRANTFASIRAERRATAQADDWAGPKVRPDDPNPWPRVGQAALHGSRRTRSTGESELERPMDPQSFFFISRERVGDEKTLTELELRELRRRPGLRDYLASCRGCGAVFTMAVDRSLAASAPVAIGLDADLRFVHQPDKRVEFHTQSHGHVPELAACGAPLTLATLGHLPWWASAAPKPAAQRRKA